MALALAGCQPRTTTSVPAPTTHGPTAAPPTITPSNPAVAARDAAIAAYRGMWAAYETASATANPDEPSLSTYATGDALAILQDGLRQLRADNQVVHGTTTFNPTVVSVSPVDAPTQISITDCADTTASVLYHRDGGPVDNTPGGWRRINTTVIAIGGVWKVSSFGVLEVGSCNPS
jgi:hypothetical protein